MHAFERGGVTPEGLLRGRKSANVRVSSGSLCKALHSDPYA